MTGTPLPDATSEGQYLLSSAPSLVANTLQRLSYEPQDVDASTDVEATVYECIQKILREYHVRSSIDHFQGSEGPILQEPVPAQSDQDPEVLHLPQYNGAQELSQLQLDEGPEINTPPESKRGRGSSQNCLSLRKTESRGHSQISNIPNSLEPLKQGLLPEESELLQAGDMSDFTGPPQQKHLPLLPELPQLDNMKFTQLPPPRDVPEFAEVLQYDNGQQTQGLPPLVDVPTVTPLYYVDNMPQLSTPATTTDPYSNSIGDAGSAWLGTPLTSYSAYFSDSPPWDPSVYTQANTAEWCKCRCHDPKGLNAELCGGCC